MTMEKTFFQKLHWQLVVFLARRLPPCNLIVPVISQAREGSLTMRERITLKLHLFTCEACRRYVRQVERMSEMVKPKSEEKGDNPANKLSQEARTRIKAALQTATEHRRN